MAVRGISQLDKLHETQATRLRNTLARNDSAEIKCSKLRDGSNSGSHDDMKLMTIMKSENCEDAVVKEVLHDELVNSQSIISQRNTQLTQKDTELAASRLLNENEGATLAGCGVGSSATQKIVNLSRKNRDLSSDLIRERTRARQLQAQVIKLQSTNKEYEKREQDSLCNPSQEHQLRDQVAQLQDQLVQCKQKSTEYRNQHLAAKQEIKTLHKIISLEVGEKINISSFISSSKSGWRGRAQQIIALQNKVSELQKQVSSHRPSVTASSRCSDRQGLSANAHVQKVEFENRRKIQELKSEFDQLQGNHSELKQQCSALKARNSTLTSEAKESRLHIDALKKDSAIKEAEVQQLKQSISELQSNPKLRNELQQMSEMIGKLRSQLSHSEGERLRLESRLKKQHPKDPSLARHSTPISSSRTSDIHKANDTIGAGSTSGCSTISSTGDSGNSNGTNDCLPPLALRGNKWHTNTRNSLSADGLQQHAKFSEAEVEGVLTRLRVAEVERDRLLGLTKMLQQRLDKANDEVIQIKAGRQTQELVIKRLSAVSSTKGEAKIHSKNTAVMDDLQDRLCILEDENEVLRDTLEQTRRQKLEDIRILNSLLSEAQASYMNSLKKCTCRSNQ